MEQQHTTSFLGSEEAPLYTPNSDERTMAILSHILTIVAGFLVPLIIYLIKKDESKYVAEHAKESLNFQITVFIAACVCIPLTLIIIGFVLMFAVIILAWVFIIMATIKASENKMYRYPINLRIIK